MRVRVLARTHACHSSAIVAMHTHRPITSSPDTDRVLCPPFPSATLSSAASTLVALPQLSHLFFHCTHTNAALELAHCCNRPLGYYMVASASSQPKGPTSYRRRRPLAHFTGTGAGSAGTLHLCGGARWAPAPGHWQRRVVMGCELGREPRLPLARSGDRGRLAPGPGGHYLSSLPLRAA